MKKQVLFGTLALLASQAFAQQAAVTGPDSRLKLDFQLQDGKPVVFGDLRWKDRAGELSSRLCIQYR